MSLNRIHIKNMKLIKELTIKPGKINQIVGKNDNGKTTVLEAIQFAMIGSTDESIISHGEERAEVDLNFSDGLSVKRWLTRGSGQGLVVEMNDMTPQRPQSFLNGLVGVGTFNPKEVLDPKNRTDYFLKTIDLKVTKEQIEEVTGDIDLPEINYDDHGLKVIQRAAQFFYDARTIANKNVKRANTDAESYRDSLGQPPADTTLKGTDEDIRLLISGYKSGLNGLKEKHNKWVEKNEAVDDHKNELIEISENIKGIDYNIKVLKDKMITLKQSKECEIDLLEKGEKINEEMIKEVGPEPDIVQAATDWTEMIEVANTELSLRNDHVSFNKQKEFLDTLDKRKNDLVGESKNLGAIYKKLTTDLTEKIMGEADLPAKGLTFEDGEFKLDGTNVDQLSSSKTLLLALAVSRKLNKKANLICVDGVELLDEQTYHDLNEEMSKDNFNYFLSKVGDQFKNTNDKIINMKNGKVH